MIGVPADSDMENRFTLLVSPQMREANGIHSMRSLIGYLRAQPDANNDMLLARLEGLVHPASRPGHLRRDVAAVLTVRVTGHDLADQPAPACPSPTTFSTRICTTSCPRVLARGWRFMA